jgi:hypothetical protein
VPRSGEKFWPLPDQITEARRRGERAHAALLAGGYDVVGDADALLVPDELEERRTPDTVTDAEVAEVAVELVATLLHDVRERSRPAPGPGADRLPPPERDKPRKASRALFKRLGRP